MRLFVLILIMFTSQFVMGDQFSIVTVSKHLHSTDKDYNEENWGIRYVSTSGLVLSTYKNSYSTTTYIVAREFEYKLTNVNDFILYGSPSIGLSYGYGWNKHYDDPRIYGATILPYGMYTLSLAHKSYRVNLHMVTSVICLSFGYVWDK